jgi:hypothetical protein
MILMPHRPTRDFFDIPGVSPAERASATVPLFFFALDYLLLRGAFFPAHGDGRYVAGSRA